MPRAQDQIQQILARVPILRQSIEDLTDNLRQLEQVGVAFLQSHIPPSYCSLHLGPNFHPFGL